MMSNVLIEKLLKNNNCQSQSDIDTLRNDMQSTIALLQAILDAPENLYIGLSLDDEDKTACWEQYEWKEAFEGTGKGHHSINMGTVKTTSISYDFAAALDLFLETIGLNHHGLELPKPVSDEITAYLVKKKIADIESSLRQNEVSKVFWQGTLGDYQKLLDELKDNE